jgi:hypothetical protein
MLSKDKIREIVDGKIQSIEKLGDQAGGSGHLSNVSYIIDEIENPVKEGDYWKIRYKYRTIITTEFNYYPDNPPYEFPHSNEILIDSEYSIIEK